MQRKSVTLLQNQDRTLPLRAGARVYAMGMAKSDVEKLFSGFSKTRENLSVVDELLTYWNLADTDRVLDDLEEVRAGFDDSAPSFSF